MENFHSCFLLMQRQIWRTPTSISYSCQWCRWASFNWAYLIRCLAKNSKLDQCRSKILHICTGAGTRMLVSHSRRNSSNCVSSTRTWLWCHYWPAEQIGERPSKGRTTVWGGDETSQKTWHHHYGSEDGRGQGCAGCARESQEYSEHKCTHDRSYCQQIRRSSLSGKRATEPPGFCCLSPEWWVPWPSMENHKHLTIAYRYFFSATTPSFNP